MAKEATTGGDNVTMHLSDEPVSAAMRPQFVLRYVLRTRESIIIDDAVVRH